MRPKKRQYASGTERSHLRLFLAGILHPRGDTVDAQKNGMPKALTLFGGDTGLPQSSEKLDLYQTERIEVRRSALKRVAKIEAVAENFLFAGHRENHLLRELVFRPDEI